MRWPRPASAIAVLRYGMAAVGPFGSAAAQFTLSLIMLGAVSLHDFGIFSFLMVTSQFSSGLWSALFCAPMPALLAQEEKEAHDGILHALFGCSLVGAAVAFVLFTGLAVALDAPLPMAVLFACYAACALLRWFARAFAYATGHLRRTMWSDLVYSITVFAGAGALVAFDVRTLDLAFATLLLGAAFSFLPFGASHLSRLFSRISRADLLIYRRVWRRHSGWSLLGVATTEATTNAHAYIVTGLISPSAFAPIAASALLLRPISIAMNALMEFERAQMATQIGEHRVDALRRGVRLFRTVLTVAWGSTAVAAAVLLTFWPGLVYPPHYDLSVLRSGTALWVLAAAVRLWRAPESALLQAAGAFRPLASASVLSAGVSIATVFAVVLAGGTVWSIAGIALGEVVFAGWTQLQAHRWFERHSTPRQRSTDPGILTPAAIAD